MITVIEETYVEPERPMIDTSRLMHVTIVLSKTNSEIKKNLRCMYCGMLLAQHFRAIEFIYEGTVMEDGTRVEIQCRRCKTIYDLL